MAWNDVSRPFDSQGRAVLVQRRWGDLCGPSGVMRGLENEDYRGGGDWKGAEFPKIEIPWVDLA